MTAEGTLSYPLRRLPAATGGCTSSHHSKEASSTAKCDRRGSQTAAHCTVTPNSEPAPPTESIPGSMPPL